jgi:hypothetical protein
VPLHNMIFRVEDIAAVTHSASLHLPNSTLVNTP